MASIRTKLISAFLLTLLVVTLVSTVLVTPVAADTETGSPTVIGRWHLDSIAASDDSVITPDAVGYNAGILGGETEPSLVDGKFDKALSFDGTGFVYVAINFVIGFPPSSQPIYQSISPKLNIQNEIKT
jgi:hypothetical protein